MGELASHLETQLRQLKLKAMLSVYRELSQRAAQGNLSYEEYLSLLLTEEARDKSERLLRGRIAKARFPFVKTLESFDFSFQPSLPEKEVLRLSTLEFVEKNENLIFLGPPGVGKTHLAIGLGLKACSTGQRVLFITAGDLLEDLMLSMKQGILAQKLLSYSRLNLLLVDELGYVPVTKDQANVLFQLVSMRYERGSMILTSNYGFEDWGQIFPDPVVAAAILDRLIHHAKIFFIHGASYRLKDKLKGAKPLTTDNRGNAGKSSSKGTTEKK